ncbi:Mevalonate kinase [uncultured archaeon]|nr:Mevalonate kinase [uncultured archaeon]
MPGKGIGYGKTILFGEHFVVYGLPAVAAAIADKTIATVEAGKSGKGIEFIDNRPEVLGYKETKKDEIKAELKAIIEHLKIDTAKTPLKITLTGDLECASGMGASAALASSVARALNEHFKLGFDDERINEIAFIAETAGSGTPSGIDNTCATYGGMIIFEKNLAGGKNKIELLKVKKPLHIVLASTGITQETKNVVAEVKRRKEKEPQKYGRIFSDYRKILNDALVALENGDAEKTGELMYLNQDLLREMSLSCPEIERIILVARENGALGAKLTGTGRGGTVICLAQDAKAQRKIAKAIEAAGFGTHMTKIGAMA